MSEQLFETEAQESARLAQMPERSVLRAVATLPVTVAGEPQGMLLRLPEVAVTGGPLVVVPTTRRLGALDAQPYRWDGDYDCLVVASADPTYPAGKSQITVCAEVLRRSALVTIDL